MTAEMYPGFDENFEKSSVEVRLGTLILNLRSSFVAAQKLQKARTESMRQEGHTSARRHILKDIKTATVPVETERVTLSADDKKPYMGVGRLVLRFPDTAAVTLPITQPNDVFTELQFTNGERRRFLLNSTGLWEYMQADEIWQKSQPYSETDNDLYVPKVPQRNAIEWLGTLDRLNEAFIPQDLLASETGIA